MKYQDISEIVTGLVLNRKLSPDSVNVSTLMQPYDQIVALLKEGKDMSDLVDKIGIAAITASDEASKRVDNILPTNWISLLEKSAARYEAATAFTKAGKQLERGEDADIGRLTEALEKINTNKLRFVRGGEVDEKEITWLRTYYAPIDKYMGAFDPANGSGFPMGGLVIIGAPPGVGKTSLLTKIIGESAKAGKESVIFSLEMTNSQIIKRLIESTGLTVEERNNILLCDEQMDVEDVYAYGCQLAALHQLHFIGVDFADLLVSGDEDDAKVGKVYRTLAKLAKVTGVPVILLSQLNREYVGGIPRITNLRYSGLAEAMGALIIMLYNPGQTWTKMGTDERLPVHEGRGYIIFGKSRFGFREGNVGAVEVEWDGLHSWGETEFGYRSLS